MNLVTHLFKKDLRRARPLLALWVLLLLLDAVLVSASINPADRLMQSLFEVITRLAPVLQVLLLAVFVPYIIQEEPLVGTTAFWLTRPLSRLKLLRSKLFFVLMVFLLPPLVVEIAVLAANGIVAHDIALAVPEVVFGRICLLLPILLLAALTPSFGQYAIAAVAIVVAMGLTELAMQMARALLHPDSLMLNLHEISLEKSAGLACTALALPLGAGVLAHQYLTRRTMRSVVALGISVGLVLLTQSLWSWDFLAPRSPSAAPPFDLSKVELQVATLHANDRSTGRGLTAPDKVISGEVDPLGVPHDIILQVREIRARLAPPGGSALPLKSAEEGSIVSNLEALESVVGEPIINFTSQFNYSTNFLTLDAETYGRNLDHPLELTADLDLVASKYVVTATLPVTVGSRYDHNSEHLVITNLLRSQLGIEVLMREHRAQLLLAPDHRIFTSYDQKSPLYVLRNGKRHEAVLQKQEGYGFPFDFGKNPILVNVAERLAFGSDPNRRQMTPELTPEWLADAELLRLELKPVGAFTKALRPEKINLNGANSLKWRTTYVKPDRARLEKIKLPEHPTKEQAREYVRAIEIATQKQTIFSQYSDPQAEMLTRVGPENLDVLIDERSANSPTFGTYLDEAIRRLSERADKGVILEALPADPELVNIVLKRGWQADVRELLTEKLSLHRSDLNSNWAKAVATFQDPATYGDLLWFFVNAYNRSDVFDAIRNLPGIELDQSVARAWVKARVDPGQAYDMLPIAAEYGHVDTLDTAMALLERKQDAENSYPQSQVTRFLSKFTPVDVSGQAPLEWMKQHRDKLVFDPQAKKFVLKE